jgi:DMSO reductase anchor subunit
MKERSLVAFTLLAQLSVGAFLVLGILDILAAFTAGGFAALFSLLDRSMPAIGLAMICALLASLLHLGTPGNAYRAATNWRSSWLSREILSSLAFAASLVLFALLKRFLPETSPSLLFFFILAASCGLALLYCMIRVYLLRTIAGWNRWTTPVSFISATLFLGSLAAGLAILYFGIEISSLPFLGGLVAIVFGIEFRIGLPELREQQGIPAPWISFPQTSASSIWRLALAAIGLLAFEMAVFAFRAGDTTYVRIYLALFGLASVFAGEILARARFYSLRQFQTL